MYVRMVHFCSKNSGEIATYVCTYILKPLSGMQVHMYIYVLLETQYILYCKLVHLSFNDAIHRRISCITDHKHPPISTYFVGKLTSSKLSNFNNVVLSVTICVT